MAATFHAEGAGGQVSSAASFSITCTITAGDHVVVYGAWDTASTTTPTVVTTGGTGSDSFTLIYGPSASGSYKYGAWLLQSAGTGRTGVTVSWASSSPSFADAQCISFSGLPGVVLDQSKFATGTSVSPSSGSTATLSSSDEFCVGYAASNNACSGAGAPWTDLGFTHGTTASWAEYRIVSSTAAVSTVFTATNDPWISFALTFMAGTTAPVLQAPKLQPKLWLKPWRFSHIQPDPPITAAAPYTLGAEPGTLTLSGQTAGLKFGHVLTAGTGTLTLGGQDVVLRVSLPAGTGTLTLAGQTAVLRATRTMVASLGTLTLGGQDVALRAARKVVAGTGTLTLSGQIVGLRATHVPLAAGTGTLTLSGQPLGLTYGRKMPAGTGTLTLSGQSATLKRTYVMPVSNGILTLSGQTVTLRFAHRMTAGLGTLTLAGQTAALRIARKAVAGTGTLVLGGQTATLKRTYKMPVGTGTLQLAGPVVNLIWSAAGAKTLPAGLGVLTLSGQAATLQYGHKAAAGLGTVTLSGQTVTLKRSRVVPVETGTLTLSGQSANLIAEVAQNYVLEAGSGMLALTGQVAELNVTEGPYVTQQPGRLRFGSTAYLRRW